MKRKIILGIAGLTTILALESKAKGQGLEPFSPFGTVQDSVGNLVPDGTSLEARIANLDTVFTQLSQDGYYGFSIPAHDSITTGFKDGDTLRIYVDGKEAHPFLICKIGESSFEPIYVDTSFGTVGIEDGKTIRHIPDGYSLSNNYPNPFNGSTKIDYKIPVAGHVNIGIYNILGQLVNTLMNETQQPGEYSIEWDGKNNAGKNAASGSYLWIFRHKETVMGEVITLGK